MASFYDVAVAMRGGVVLSDSLLRFGSRVNSERTTVAGRRNQTDIINLVVTSRKELNKEVYMQTRQKGSTLSFILFIFLPTIVFDLSLE